MMKLCLKEKEDNFEKSCSDWVSKEKCWYIASTFVKLNVITVTIICCLDHERHLVPVHWMHLFFIVS